MPTNPGVPARQLRSLKGDDFDRDNPESDGWERLWSICEELQDRGAVMDCADDMFELMERLDGVDLGTTGPLVHALESTGAAYESGLGHRSDLAVATVGVDGQSHPQHGPGRSPAVVGPAQPRGDAPTCVRGYSI